MQLRVLGCMEVAQDGLAIPIQGARRRSVLATLALNPGEIISVEKIIDAVWGQTPPATARNTVQSHMSALRKLVGDPGSIVNRKPGYQILLPELGTDVLFVQKLLAQAGEATGPADRLPLLRRALAQWRGTSLADVGESSYLSWQATSLEELRTTIHENAMTDQLRLGQHQMVIPDLDILRATHPFRERPVRLLMTALFRDGRSSDAFAAYQRLRDVLRDELGIAPSRLTVDLHRRIQRSDVSLLTPPAINITRRVDSK